MRLAHATLLKRAALMGVVLPALSPAAAVAGSLQTTTLASPSATVAGSDADGRLIVTSPVASGGLDLSAADPVTGIVTPLGPLVTPPGQSYLVRAVDGQHLAVVTHVPATTTNNTDACTDDQDTTITRANVQELPSASVVHYPSEFNGVQVFPTVGTSGQLMAVETDAHCRHTSVLFAGPSDTKFSSVYEAKRVDVESDSGQVAAFCHAVVLGSRVEVTIVDGTGPSPVMRHTTLPAPRREANANTRQCVATPSGAVVASTFIGQYSHGAWHGKSPVVSVAPDGTVRRGSVPYSFNTAAVRRDGQAVAVTSISSQLAVLDMATGQLRKYPLPASLRSDVELGERSGNITWNAQSSTILIPAEDRHHLGLVSLDLRSGTWLRAVGVPTGGDIQSCVAPNGRTIALVERGDRAIALFESDTTGPGIHALGGVDLAAGNYRAMLSGSGQQCSSTGGPIPLVQTGAVVVSYIGS